MRSTINSDASPHPLTAAVARAIRPHWQDGNLAAVAAAAIRAVCDHLARTTDETIDPRVNEAIDQFLAFEYREGDTDQLRECAAEDIPGQTVLNFFDGAGYMGGVRSRLELEDRGAPPNDPSIDPEETISFDVEHRPDGTIGFRNVRPLRSITLALLASLVVFTGCAAGDGGRRGADAQHHAPKLPLEAPASTTRPTGTTPTPSPVCSETPWRTTVAAAPPPDECPRWVLTLVLWLCVGMGFLVGRFVYKGAQS